MRHGFIKVASASPSLKVGNPDYNKGRIIGLMKEADKEGVKVLVSFSLQEGLLFSKEIFLAYMKRF